MLSKVNTLAMDLFSLAPAAKTRVSLKHESEIPYEVYLLNVHRKLETCFYLTYVHISFGFRI